MPGHRAPFIQLAFDLYDTAEYTLDGLAEELYDRGLRTRPTAKHPAKKVSINKLSQMLRDRYYLGYVTYKGEEIQGRHQPLIDEDLFDRVQDRLHSRSAAKERRRVHHHYLKGSLFCGRCHRAGITQRMIIQRTINSKGTEYLYFFCRNRQSSTCNAPHVNAALVEDAVERHYATIRFSQAFIRDVRNQIDTVISEQEKSARLLHQQLSTQLAELDTQEENLVDLAADSTLPQTKVKAKLRDIERQRRHLTQRHDTATADLTDAARLIGASLTCSNNSRRSTGAATTNNGAYSTKPSSTASTSRTTRSPATISRNPSGNSTPSSRRNGQRETHTTPRPPFQSPETAKRPPAKRMAHPRPQASRSYSKTFNQAHVLVVPPG